jgi:hypothetical protein
MKFKNTSLPQCPFVNKIRETSYIPHQSLLLLSLLLDDKATISKNHSYLFMVSPRLIFLYTIYNYHRSTSLLISTIFRAFMSSIPLICFCTQLYCFSSLHCWIQWQSCHHFSFMSCVSASGLPG